jgi:hypothetical protein
MAFGTATILTNVGKGIVAKRLIGTTPAQITPNFQAIGTGATGAGRTAVAGDTALTTEVETRVSTNAGTTVTTTQTNDTFQVIQTTTCTADRSVDEAGLFDQTAVGGNMFISATFSVVSLKLAGPDGLQLTWKYQST